MGIVTTYPLTNPLNFTLTNTQIAASVGKLALTAKPSIVHSADLSTATPSSEAEYVGGILRQKDQTPSGSVMASLLTTKDLNWHKSGSLTGTLNGTPTFSGSGMFCTGAQGVFYTKTTASQEVIRFKWVPDFTGGPGVNINLTSLKNPSNNNDQFALTYSPSDDNLRITLRNQSGVSIYSAQKIGANGFTVVSGTTYRITVIINSVAGTVQVNVNGSTHGTLSPGAWTRGGTSASYYVGATPNIYNIAKGTFRDPMWFDGVSWPAGDYVVPPFIYTTSSVTGLGFNYPHIGVIQALTGFAATVANTPKFTLDGKYWNGSAWVASAGSYAQANTVAEISANIGSLTAPASVISITAYFTPQNVQGSISALSLTYTGQKYFASGSFEPAQAFPVQDLIDLDLGGVVTPAGTELRALVKVDSVPKWWNGTAWVTSNGSQAQTNTIAEVQANAAALDMASNAYVKPCILAYTTDDDETPELASIIMEYDFGGIASNPDVCLVWGYLKKPGGQNPVPDPIAGATVTFSMVKKTGQYREAAGNVIGLSVSVTTDENGYYEAYLIRSSAFEAAPIQYEVTWTKEADGLDISVIKTKPLKFTVPDKDDENITELLTEVA